MAITGVIINGCLAYWLLGNGEPIGGYMSLAVVHAWGIAYYMKKGDR